MQEQIQAVRNAVANLATVARHLHTPLDTSAVEKALAVLDKRK